MLSLREAYKALESAVHQVRLYLGTSGSLSSACENYSEPTNRPFHIP